MAALTVDTPREYESNEDPLLNDLPVLTNTKIYEGAIVGNAGAGYMKEGAATNEFVGFAVKQADNSSGASGDIDVRVRQQGTVKIAVTGVTGVTNVGALVYAKGANALSLTAGTDKAIGKVVRYISGTTCMVRFEGIQLASR